MLKKKVKILKYHLYVQLEQHKAYNNIKNNMGENEMLVHVDFAEKYENKQQLEIQSAYFGHTTSAYLLLAVTPEIRMVRFIGSPKDFAEFADANVNNISVIYVPNSDIITEPDYVKDTRYVDSMQTLSNKYT